jgi:hypothetical protein
MLCASGETKTAPWLDFGHMWAKFQFLAAMQQIACAILLRCVFNVFAKRAQAFANIGADRGMTVENRHTKRNSRGRVARCDDASLGKRSSEAGV